MSASTVSDGEDLGIPVLSPGGTGGQVPPPSLSTCLLCVLHVSVSHELIITELFPQVYFSSLTVMVHVDATLLKPTPDFDL